MADWKRESAADALGKVIMSQQEAQENPPDNQGEAGEEEKPEEKTEVESEEEKGRIDEALQQRIADNRARRNADIASQFERLDTKVQIGDIGRNFDRTRSPRVQRTQIAAQAKEGTRDSKIKERTDTWQHWIIEDLNPLLLKATQTWCGIPDFWLDNKIFQAIDPTTNKALIFWDPPLRSRLELSEKKAKTLAKAAAEFSVSPMGVAIVTWVETHQFIISVGAAMWVAAQYGWLLMQTKSEVATVRQVIEQQQAAAMQNAMVQNGEARYPNFGEKTTEYDAESNS